MNITVEFARMIPDPLLKVSVIPGRNRSRKTSPMLADDWGALSEQHGDDAFQVPNNQPMGKLLNQESHEPDAAAKVLRRARPMLSSELHSTNQAVAERLEESSFVSERSFLLDRISTAWGSK